MSTADGRDISGSAIIGPFNEGHELRLICQSSGGKPIPRVTWFNGSNVISGKDTAQLMSPRKLRHFYFFALDTLFLQAKSVRSKRKMGPERVVTKSVYR